MKRTFKRRSGGALNFTLPLISRIPQIFGSYTEYKEILKKLLSAALDMRI